jgi:S-DNA-T family DNA segregation ATPase FtsK/SpoIIIE
VNRLMQTVTRASREFANASAAVDPLVRTLSSNADRARDARFAEQTSLLQALQARSHALLDPPTEPDAFTTVHASTAEWRDDVWSRFVPAAPGLGVPRLTRVGDFSRDVVLPDAPKSQQVTFPALVPIIGRGGLVVLAEGKQLDEARNALQSTAVRLIAALPPGLLRLTLVDHLGVGNNFSLLTPFHEVIRGPMVWHDPRQIASALDALIEHMAMVTQKYLKTQYKDIETYNNDQGVVEEPYRVLAIANFPAGFDPNTARQVISIAQNGPRSGMYIIASIDRKAPMPHGFNLTDLTRFCTVLEGTMTSGFVWKPNTQGLSDNAGQWVGDVFSRGRVGLDGAPSKEIVENLAEATDALAADKQSVKVSFDRFVPAQLWAATTKDGISVPSTTKDGISVPIGRRGSEDQLFEFSRGADAVHHALIGGRTGSGKSVLIKGLITSLCMHYSPEELELYLIDFKGGVEFRVFSDLRHARVVAIDSEREFGLSVLEGLLNEKSEREKKFKASHANNISEYRKNGEKMTRIVLIVDEFQVFFDATDRISSRAPAPRGELARRGRRVRLHRIQA